jgi:hypothetical protein
MPESRQAFTPLSLSLSLSNIPVAPSVPQAAAERPVESVSSDTAHSAEGREKSKTGRGISHSYASEGVRYLFRSQSALGLKGQANFKDRYTQPALAAGLIEMTVPDKPRSSKQRYRITPPGLAALKRIEAEK